MKYWHRRIHLILWLVMIAGLSAFVVLGNAMLGLHAEQMTNRTNATVDIFGEEELNLKTKR